MGGAGRFLAFLRDELKPWVRERYGVDPDDSAFFGYSLGGLFATYVLLNEPATFRRYGIGSPPLGWDNGAMFDHEAEYARTHDDLPAKVFFSVGANENTEGQRRWRAQLPADRRAKAEAQAEGDPQYKKKDTPADVERISCEKWGGLRGLNPQPSEPQSDALPIELRPPRSQRAARPGPARGTGGVYASARPGRVMPAVESDCRVGNSARELSRLRPARLAPPPRAVRRRSRRSRLPVSRGGAPGPPRRRPSRRCRAGHSPGSSARAGPACGARMHGRAPA